MPRSAPARFSSPRGLALATVPTERRFIFIIQRGAADGLDILRPTGDPAFSGLRGGLIGDVAGMKLDTMFSLHPALVEVGRMYGQGQALFVHAVASPYRDRSHFDGQNVLETGGAQPYAVRDGWLNRLVTMLPRSSDEAIAIAATVPTALRGSVQVASYAPSALPHAADDLMARVTALYDADPQLHPVWSAALETQGPRCGRCRRAGSGEPRSSDRQLSHEAERSADRDARNTRLGHAQRTGRAG